MTRLTMLAASTAMLSLAACAAQQAAAPEAVVVSAPEPVAAVPAAAPKPQPRYAPFGLELKDMDTSVKPGDDFFEYAEGTWLRDHPIPADKSGAGYNYELPDEIDIQLKQLVEQAATDPGSPLGRKIGDAYAAFTDTAAIDAARLAPAQPYLDKIASVSNRDQLVQLMMQPGYASPVNLYMSADQDDPTRYTVFASQAGLSLPGREYYLSKDAKYADIRKAYITYVTKLGTLAGWSDPAGRAKRILALETAIAKDQWTPEARRDPIKTHNPMNRAKLMKLAPEFDWDKTLASVGLASATTVDVGEPSAIAAAGDRIADKPLSTWKEYLTYRFFRDHGSVLPSPIDQANFDFFSKTLRDVPEQRARWKRGIAMVDGDLGEALGQLYVAKYWSDESARQAKELVADVRAAYGDKIRNADWMDDATKGKALEKLASFDPRVGYPSKWIDYTNLAISRTDPLANQMAAEQFQWDLALSRFPNPVDRTLWGMTPQTVNAYYEPTMNQITVPAAILQPPFFDANADPAVNYAETGATTIGHELGHGFDDEGRQYDAHGRLNDWWTPETAAKYKVKAAKLAKQFDQYEPIPGVHIKGELTLGENLADLGGLEAAYDAYRRYVDRHGEPPVIAGFTGDQRFFLAYAQAWQGKTREGAERAMLVSNPHSPEKYRVDGIVRNFDPWYKAFNVQPGDKLYLPPEERVHVW
jgi:endothelin-converting enzyme/putative endopeptidase